MTEYYIIDNNDNQGCPISEVLFSNYGVNANTLVWCEGMPEWKHASEVPELRHLFGPTIPPAPPVTPPPFQDQSVNGWNPPQQTYDQWNQPPEFEEQCPPSYLGWAIIATLLCCLPCGVVGIVYAAKVESQWNLGNLQAARKSSRLAKMWTLISVGLTVAGYGLYFALVVLFGILSL